MTSHTIASFTGLVQSKAITVKFKTFSFFTITEDFFIGVDLFGLVADSSWFACSVSTFYLFLEGVYQILGWLPTILLLTFWRRRTLILGVLKRVAWSDIILLWTLERAWVVRPILSFRLEDNLVDDGRLIRDQFWRLLNNWGVYLNVITWVTIVWTKDVVIDIIHFGRERKRRQVFWDLSLWIASIFLDRSFRNVFGISFYLAGFEVFNMYVFLVATFLGHKRVRVLFKFKLSKPNFRTFPTISLKNPIWMQYLESIFLEMYNIP